MQEEKIQAQTQCVPHTQTVSKEFVFLPFKPNDNKTAACWSSEAAPSQEYCLFKKTEAQ